ncbi:hypothetical protein LTR40_012801, partial [Exophiala xenobiotica]
VLTIKFGAKCSSIVVEARVKSGESVEDDTDNGRAEIVAVNMSYHEGLVTEAHALSRERAQALELWTGYLLARASTGIRRTATKRFEIV